MFVSVVVGVKSESFAADLRCCVKSNVLSRDHVGVTNAEGRCENAYKAHITSHVIYSVVMVTAHHVRTSVGGH